MRRRVLTELLMAAALAATAACGGPAATDRAASAPTRTASAEDDAVTQISLPAASGGVAVAGGSVWVVPHKSSRLFRIDPGTHEVTDYRLPGNGPGAEITADENGIWLTQSDASFAPTRLVRIDPGTGAVVADLPLKVTHPALGTSTVWAASPTELHRIDTSTNKVSGKVPVPGGCGRPLVVGGRVWCLNEQGLVAIDEESLAVTASPVAGLPPVQLPVAVAGGRLWLLSQGADALIGVDPRSASVSATVELPQGLKEFMPDAVELDGVLWASARADDDSARLVGFDLTSLEVHAVQPVKEPEFGMAAGFGSVWVPWLRVPVVQRLTPGE